MGFVRYSLRLTVLALVLTQFWCGHLCFAAVTNVGLSLYNYGPSAGDTKLELLNKRIELDIPFKFFGQEFSSLCLHYGGYLTFQNCLGLREVLSFHSNMSMELRRLVIAPLWTVCDHQIPMSTFSRVYYRASTEDHILRRAAEQISNGVPKYRSFSPVWAFIVTNENLPWQGYDSFMNNTFQCVLVTDGLMTFTFFLYKKINYVACKFYDERNDDQFYPYGYAGFGDGVRYFAVPGSGTDGLWNFVQSSNVGIPGQWIFRTDSHEWDSPEMNNSSQRHDLILVPTAVQVMGGTRIVIAGSGLRNATCWFGSEQVIAEFFLINRMACISPPLFREKLIGYRLPLRVVVSTSANGIHKEQEYSSVLFIRREDLLPPRIRFEENEDGDITFSWPRNLFTKNSTLILSFMEVRPSMDFDVGIQSLKEATYDFTPFAQLENKGEIKVPASWLPFDHSIIGQGDLSGFGVYTLEEFNQAVTDRRRTKRFILPLVKPLLHITKALVRNRKIRGFIVTKIIPRLARYVKKKVRRPPKLKNVTEAVLDYTIKQVCQLWISKQRSISKNLTAIWKQLPTCPCNLRQAEAESRCGKTFQDDPACKQSDNSSCRFHPGAVHCLRSIQSSNYSAGQQCCYGPNGNLLINDPDWKGDGDIPTGGGTADLSHFKGNTIPYFGHFWHDVLPYLGCCEYFKSKDNSLCREYLRYRPSTSCTGYQPSDPNCAVTFGDPHVVTLDGHQYTFNGLGEYILAQCDHPREGRLLSMQGRTARTLSTLSRGSTGVDATNWQAIAVNNSGVLVEFRLANAARSDSLEVLINSVPSPLEDDVMAEDFPGVFIYLKRVRAADTSHAEALFISGMKLHLESENGMLTFFARLPGDCQGHTEGLLGVWDGNSANDLRDSSGKTLPNNSSEEEIYHRFGETWRVPEKKSLFNYPFGTGYDDYNRPDFVPTFSSEITATDEAKQICNLDKTCLFDFTVTGKAAVATTTKKIVAQVEMLKQVKEEPVILCKQPPAIAQGTFFNLNQTDTFVGVKVRYSCESGYSFFGNSELVCREDGIWSPLQSGVCRRDRSQQNHAGPAPYAVPTLATFRCVYVLLLALVLEYTPMRVW